MCFCCSCIKHPELVVSVTQNNIIPNSSLTLVLALINNSQVGYHMLPCVFLILTFFHSLLKLEFPWFQFAITLMSHTVVSFLFCFKVMAAAVWLPAPRGHEDPFPPLPSLHPLGHRCYAEVLRPDRHRQL